MLYFPPSSSGERIVSRKRKLLSVSGQKVIYVLMERKEKAFEPVLIGLDKGST